MFLFMPFKMEFKNVDGKWERRELNDSNVFVIITKGGNAIEIPNFIKTKTIRYDELEKRNNGWHSVAVSRDIFYECGIIPTFNIHNFHENVIESYFCNVFNARWHIYTRFDDKHLKIKSEQINRKINRLDRQMTERRLEIKKLLFAIDFILNDLLMIVCEYV